MLAGTLAGAVGQNIHMCLLHVPWVSSQLGSMVSIPKENKEAEWSHIAFYDLAQKSQSITFAKRY